MGRLSVTVLILWALCFSGTDCGSAKVQSPQSRDTKTAELPASPVVTLTHERPSSSLPVAANVITSGAEILEVAITKVVNPGMTPLEVFVYLSYTDKGKSEPDQKLLGNFSLYPPDQPGKFLLNPARALRRAADSARAPHEVRLVFTMKRVDEAKPWTPVELTIAEPHWRAAEK